MPIFAFCHPIADSLKLLKLILTIYLGICTQNVGYYPRRSRYENIKNRAFKSNAKLSILYNTTFLNNLSKAKRWGINSREEFFQEGFFAADIGGINKLEKKLQASTDINWVLLLNVNLIPNLYYYSLP